MMEFLFVGMLLLLAFVELAYPLASKEMLSFLLDHHPFSRLLLFKVMDCISLQTPVAAIDCSCLSIGSISVTVSFFVFRYSLGKSPKGEC